MVKSLDKMVKLAQVNHLPLWEMILEDDIAERQVTREDSLEKMQGMYQVMKEANRDYNGDLRSASGLVGNDGEKLQQARGRGEMLCGDFMGRVMEIAVKMGESNACMRRVVAAPTAGASGVLPAVFLPMQDRFGLSDEKMLEALYVAGGVGEVIANRAFISGALGGCQSEIGSASAMAAAGAVALRDGDPEEIIHAAAMALKNLIGLVCDPVGGLVEVPCVKRNVIGAVNALAAADMALAGIRSQIPPDEVIDVIRDVGERMPAALRETGEGGLAATPTGQEIQRRI